MALPKTPIKRRLQLVILLTSLAVLLITSTAFILYELIASSQELQRNVRMAAHIVADQLPSSLIYQSVEDAEEVLAALKSAENIEAAALYDTNGTLFVYYPTNALLSVVPSSPPSRQSGWTATTFFCTVPVVQLDKRAGTIYVRSNLSPVYDRVKLYSFIGLIVMAGSFLVALLLSNHLQKDISEPILKLAQLATVVSERRDYTVRAARLSDDELGLLTDAFNHMLVQIQDREGALRESADRLRLALQAAQIGIWEWRIPADRVERDAFVYRQFGMESTSEPATFQNFLEAVHPEDRAKLRQTMEETVKSRGELNTEFRVIWRDKSIHYIATRGRAIYDASGAPVRMTGASLEVTEQKRAEEAQSLVVAIVQSSDDAILAKDIEGRIISWNAGAERMFGYTAAEIVGRSVEILSSPEHPHEEAQILGRIREGSRVEQYETLRVRKDGRAVHVSLSVSPIRNAKGEIVSISSIARDITERKRAEEVLRRQAEALQEQARLLDLANVLAREMGGRIILWSAGMEQLYGWSKEEAMGKISHELLATEFPGGLEAVNNHVVEHGDWTGELVHTRRNGQRLIVASHWVLHKPDDGGTAAIMEVNNDITDRRSAEEEIRRLNAELEQRVRDRTAELTEANRELEAFTYSVSHDLRAPLRHIDAFARIVEEELPSTVNVEIRNYVTRIRKGTQTMGRLVDDLLNLSRVGRAQLGWQSVDLNAVVADVLADLKSETAQRQIEWRIAPLPVVQCDPGLIKQVFANLLANAVKYTRPREKALIEIGRTVLDEQLVIFVRDNGVGFDMKYINKLFGVFERLHRAEDFEGTGIGLATVRRIIQKHNGRVWAEAEPDKGATFYFTLEGMKDELSHCQNTPAL